MPWTSLQDEAALFADADAAPHAHVQALGESVQGRAIRAVSFGPNREAGQADIVFAGLLHGNEPAGRQAQLNRIGDWLASPPGFLSTLTITIVPTVNPDGFVANSRDSAGIDDLNRDWMALSQPETRAVAPLLQARQPYLLVDQHEAITAGGDDIQFACSEMRNGVDATTELGEDIRDHLIAEAIARSHDSGIWMENEFRSWRLLDVHAQMRHAVGILVETRRGSGGSVDEAHRTELQEDAFDDVIAWVLDGTHHQDLVDTYHAARAQQQAWGASGEPLLMRNSVQVNPLAGYRLTGVQYAATVFHRQVFGIATDGPIVPMEQPARVAIPVLLDGLSIDSIVAATPTSDLDPAPGQVTVTEPAEYAPILSGSHHPVFEAVVVTDFQAGDQPDGEVIPIVDGAVVMDGTADVQRSLDLTTIGHKLFPRRIGDLLLPDRTEIFVRRGIDLGDRILWTPLGYFRIQTPEQRDAPDGPIRITGYDRMRSIVDAELMRPKMFAAGRTFGSVVGELVHEVYPQAAIVWDDDTEHEQIGRLLVVEQSRHEVLHTLTQGRGKIMHWDGEGVLRIRTAPDPQVPVWDVRSGRGGVLTTASRRITRDDVINAVVVRSQGGDAQEPARAVAIDDGPQSITRFGGRFGQVPARVTVPARTSGARAVQTAVDTLRRRAGVPYQIEFEATPNSALTPYDAVRATLRDGSRETHVMQRLVMPLVADRPMQGTSREQRGSRIRAVTL